MGSSIGISNALVRCQNGVLHILRWLLFGSGVGDPKRILVYRIGGIGDNVRAVPALLALRETYPDAEIDLLFHTGGKSYGTLEGFLSKGVIDDFLNYESTSLKAVRREARDKVYDLYVCLPKVRATFTDMMKNMVFAKSLSVQKAFGWRVEMVKFLIRERKFDMNSFEREPVRLLKILHQQLGTTLRETYSFREEKDPISLTLSFPDQPIIAMGVGGTHDYQHWPFEHYQSLCQELFHYRVNVVLFGGNAEKKEAAAREFPTNVINLCGELDVAGTLRLLRSCDLFVGNDTGALHLADALRMEIIGLYSAANPGMTWWPTNPSAKILHQPETPCAPCIRYDCQDNVCLNTISVERVMNEVKRNLSLT